MKNIIAKILLLSLMIFIGTSGFSQTKEELHKDLTAHHKKAKEHAHSILGGLSKSKESHKMHAAEAEKSLESAKTSHEKLKAAMPEKYKAVAKVHHDAIDKHHEDATQHLNALKEELNKPKHDESKVKEHARKLHESIEKAEKEHQILKKKTK